MGGSGSGRSRVMYINIIFNRLIESISVMNNVKLLLALVVLPIVIGVRPIVIGGRPIVIGGRLIVIGGRPIVIGKNGPDS